MLVRIEKATVLSGRGGYPSIGYCAVLRDVLSNQEVARTKAVSILDSWRAAGRRLAKRKGWRVA